MMLHSWNVMNSRNSSANVVNTAKTTNAGVMNAYAVHSRRMLRSVARAPRGSRGTGGATASVFVVTLARPARSPRDDLLGLGGGGVERLVGRLVAVHRLAEVVVERLFDLRPLRVRDHVRDAALHLVGEAGQDRLLLGQLRRVQQRRARRQRRPGGAAERPLRHVLR